MECAALAVDIAAAPADVEQVRLARIGGTFFHQLAARQQRRHAVPRQPADAQAVHIISDLRKTGVATLLIEQNARAALQVADYGYVLETGDMTLEGPAQELAVNPRVIETYLGLAKKAA